MRQPTSALARRSATPPRAGSCTAACTVQMASAFSVLVIAYADLERRKHSPFGRYMQRYMNLRVEAWRFFGQVLMWVGAWYRVGKLIPIGWAIVVAAWVSGLWRKPTN